MPNHEIHIPFGDIPELPVETGAEFYVFPADVPGNRCYRRRGSDDYVTFPPLVSARCERHRYRTIHSIPFSDITAINHDFSMWEPGHDFCVAAEYLLRMRPYDDDYGRFDAGRTFLRPGDMQ